VGSRLGTLGPLQTHTKTHDVKTGSSQPASALLLAQIEWLSNVKARQQAEKNVGGDGASEDDDDAEEEGAADVVVADGRRGRPRWLRSNVKYKYRLLKLFDAAQEEMFKEAEKNGRRLPNKAEIFARLEQNGLSEKSSNLYHWLEQRKEIEKRFAEAQLRKVKSVGNPGRPLFPLTEQVVKKMIEERRHQGLRVSRHLVKQWLVSKAKELEPVAAATAKFGRKLFRGAYRRMGVVVRRISSTKAVTEENAAQFGRFFCRQLMEVRQNGFSRFFPDKSWCTDTLKDSVFGFFLPEHIFAADEVPFNFAADGVTVTQKGSHAAVRTLRGTGKRFGTCVMVCNGAGEMLKFVLIFKAGKKGLSEKEMERFKPFSNVIVTWTKSSYISEDIWGKKVIEGVLLKHIMQQYGRDFHKRRFLFLSDNHSSHQTVNVLETCFRNSIWPAFTPPNFTCHWSLIDDYVGTGARREFYDLAEQYEMDYFEKNPNGDGGIAAAERRFLAVKWWDETFAATKDAGKVAMRVNTAKRVGLYVTPQRPVDGSYLPAPARFQNTAYQFFGETLYDASSPDHTKEKSYDFAFERGKKITIREVQAHDEDEMSHEEGCVWLADEAEQNDVSEVGSEDVEALQEAIVARRAQRRVTGGNGRIVDQFDALAAAEKSKKKKKKT
jgi:hypothetical protein